MRRSRDRPNRRNRNTIKNSWLKIVAVAAWRTASEPKRSRDMGDISRRETCGGRWARLLRARQSRRGRNPCRKDDALYSHPRRAEPLTVDVTPPSTSFGPVGRLLADAREFRRSDLWNCRPPHWALDEMGGWSWKRGPRPDSPGPSLSLPPNPRDSPVFSDNRDGRSEKMEVAHVSLQLCHRHTGQRDRVASNSGSMPRRRKLTRRLCMPPTRRGGQGDGKMTKQCRKNDERRSAMRLWVCH